MVESVIFSVGAVAWAIAFFASIALCADLIADFIDAVEKRDSLWELFVDRFYLLSIPVSVSCSVCFDVVSC